MRKLLNFISNVFSKVFCSRKIVIISDRKMRELNVPGYAQFAVFCLILGAALWFPYSAGRVAGYDIKSENELVLIENYDNVEYRVQQIEKNLNTLEQYMKALNSTGLSVKESKIDMPEKEPNKKKYKDKLSLLEDRQYELVADFYNNTAQRIGVMEKVFSTLKIDYSAAIQSAGIRRSGIGGPYVPLDTTEDAKNYFIGEEFVENFKYLYYLKKMASRLPLMSPLDKPRVTSRYGSRRDPFTGKRAMHSGIDLVSDKDPSVYATAPGIITYAGRNGAYGKLIKIQHDNGYETRYAHLKMMNVYKGQRVKRGDVIGIQGNTGRSTGTHLHYEIRKNGQHFSPAKFLQQAHYLDFHNYK